MGKLIASYEVHCTECENPMLGIGYTRSQAIKELRRCGWRQKINGNWFCKECAEAQP